ncbi:hypothetical protein [Rhizobium sp. A37_96]
MFLNIAPLQRRGNFGKIQRLPSCSGCFLGSLKAVNAMVEQRRISIFGAIGRSLQTGSNSGHRVMFADEGNHRFSSWPNSAITKWADVLCACRHPSFSGSGVRHLRGQGAFAGASVPSSIVDFLTVKLMFEMKRKQDY